MSLNKLPQIKLNLDNSCRADCCGPAYNFLWAGMAALTEIRDFRAVYPLVVGAIGTYMSCLLELNRG